MRPVHSARGASLVEVLVASAILATGVLSLVHLFALSATSNLTAKDTTMATILAAQKVEELRALGSALTETTGPTLVQNALDTVDHLDAAGAVVGLGPQSPPRAVYTRRWSIARLSSDPEALFVIQVRVFVRGRASDGGGKDGYTRKAQLATLESRRVE